MIMQVSYKSTLGNNEEEKTFFYDDQIYDTEDKVKQALELADLHGEVEGGFILGNKGCKVLHEIFRQVEEDTVKKFDK